MSRRSKTKPVGPFTGSEWSIVQVTLKELERLVTVARTNKFHPVITMDECLNWLIRKEHLDALKLAKRLTKFVSRRTDVNAGSFTYNGVLGEHLTEPSIMVIAQDGFDALIPENELPTMYPASFTPYIEAMLATHIDFAVLHKVVRYLVEDVEVTMPQFRFLFPPIISVLASDSNTAHLAEKHATLTVPRSLPDLPSGLRDVLAKLESVVGRAMLIDKNIESNKVKLPIQVTITPTSGRQFNIAHGLSVSM